MIDALPEPKPAHIGVAAPPLGPLMHVIIRHDGKIVGVEPSRHDCAWLLERLHSCDDYRIELVPIGAIPLADLNAHFI